jgi:hypothetical protein
MEVNEMTKCVNLTGEDDYERVKPIDFVHVVDSFDKNIRSALCKPSYYDEIRLAMHRGILVDDKRYDIMVAIDKKSGYPQAHVYFGYWNDGVVS